MQCPNCKTEMEKGYLMQGFMWVEKLMMPMGKSLGLKLAGLGLGKKAFVIAYRCPNCKKIELISE